MVIARERKGVFAKLKRMVVKKNIGSSNIDRNTIVSAAATVYFSTAEGS